MYRDIRDSFFEMAPEQIALRHKRTNRDKSLSGLIAGWMLILAPLALVAISLGISVLLRA